MVGRAALLLSLGGIALLLLGCGVDEPLPAASSPPRRQQPRPALSLDMPFSKAEDDAYRYDPTGRRDPFKPLILAQKPAAPGAEERMSCPPLQDFELASLKLVAIVWGELGRKAMLKAPNGRGYAIGEEMLVGRNCARVRRIEPNAVIIEEIRPDADGQPRKEDVVLRLREGEG
jgi:type IV pilus assembly protein PilP